MSTHAALEKWEDGTSLITESVINKRALKLYLRQSRCKICPIYYVINWPSFNSKAKTLLLLQNPKAKTKNE